MTGTLTVDVDDGNGTAGETLAIQIVDEGTPTDGMMRVDLPGAFEDFIFDAATVTSFVLNGDTDDNDQVSFVSKDEAFTADVMIDGRGGSDSISFDNPLDFGAAKLNLTAETIAQGTGDAISTTGLTTLDAGATGTITLTEAGNDFGTVKVANADNVTLVDANDIDLGNSTINGDLTVTAGGNITDSGNLTVGGTATFDAATITVKAGVTANAVSLTHTGLLDINSNGVFDLNGTFTEQGGGTVDLSGDITTTGDDITFQDAVTLTADVALSTGTGAGDVSFASTLNDDGGAGGMSNRNLTITAGTGDVTFTGAVGDTLYLQSLTIASANVATFAGTVGVSDALNATATEIDFAGGANSVSTSNSGSLVLAPADASQAIVVGGTTNNTADAILDITDTDLAAIADGFSEITIGNEAAGTGAVTILSSTFRDFITIVGGSISVTELDAGNNNVSLIARTGAITDGGDGGTDITAGNVKLDSQTGVGATGDGLSTAITQLAARAAASGGVFLTDTNAGLSVNDVDGLTGVTTNGGAIVLVVDSTFLNVDRSINSTGGSVSLSAGGNVILTNTNTISTGGGDLTIAADSDGNGSGSYVQNSTVGAGAGAISITAADVLLLNSLSGTSTLTLTPSTSNRTIGIGGGAGDFNLSDADLANLTDGFSSITIGDAVNGTGAVNIDSSVFNDPVTIVGGSIDVDGLNAGENAVTLTARNNGVISSPPGVSAAQEITGGTITLNGQVSPGGSPGQFDMTGNLVLDAADTYVVELNGPNAGTDYDQINVTGQVQLGGAMLDASRGVDFVPDVGDVFTIVIATTGVSGTFAGLVDGSVLSIGDINFQINYTTSAVTLTVLAPDTVYVDDNFPNPTTGEDPDESPNDPGTPNVPGTPAVFGYDAFSTIQAGVDQVAVGGTIIVNPGLYNESVSIGKNLTLDGSGPGTILNASGNGLMLLDGASTLTIQDLRIVATGSGLVDASAAPITSLTLSNLLIDGNGLFPGGTLDGVTALTVNLTAGADVAHVDNLEFSSTGLDPITYANVGTFSLNGQDGNDIFNVDPISSTTLTVDGGNPTTPPGDTLNYSGPGLVTSGTITQPGFNPVSYTGMENVTTPNASVSGTNGNFRIAATADANDGDDDGFILRLSSDGLRFEVFAVDDAGNPVLVFSQLLADVNSITIEGSNDNDTLTVDYSNGAPIPTGGLFYHGHGDGINDHDVLFIQNGSVVSVAHTFATSSNGSVRIESSTNTFQDITYTGLEPITDTLLAEVRTFTFGANADLITLSDDGPDQPGISRISSASTSEVVDFANPAGLLVINVGGGDDTITLLAPDADFAADLMVNGGLGRDTFDLEAASADGRQMAEYLHAQRQRRRRYVQHRSDADDRVQHPHQRRRSDGPSRGHVEL